MPNLWYSFIALVIMEWEKVVSITYNLMLRSYGVGIWLAVIPGEPEVGCASVTGTMSGPCCLAF